MFKVPDWGNDIPKSNIEVSNIFTKKNKKKNIKSNTTIKDNVTKLVKLNKKRSKVSGTGNLVNKSIQNSKQHQFSKDDHINFRILRRNLKANQKEAYNACNNNLETVNSKEKFSEKIEINNNLKKKTFKTKKKPTKGKISSRKSVASKQTKVVQRNNENMNDSVKTQKSRKRKHAQNCETGINIEQKRDTKEVNRMEIENFNSDKPDKLLVNAKRKKLNDKIKSDDIEDVLFNSRDSMNVKIRDKNKNKKSVKKEERKEEENVVPSSKVETDNMEQLYSRKNKKIQEQKERLKMQLEKESNRSSINTSGNKLRMKMLERIKAAQFRYLNEKLYTSSGSESQELFKLDPTAFQTYHEGYQQQVKKWPINPLDLVVKRIQKMPKTYRIADMGCGEAALSKRVPHSVRSFDLMVHGPGVEACNMAHTPLLTASMDVVVYCLALMGTDLTQYLLEANRVLKIGGHLLIAEVESRFDKPESFCSDVQRLGFSLKNLDKNNKMFFFIEFNKVRDAPTKKHKLPMLNLKPCLYKKR